MIELTEEVSVWQRLPALVKPYQQPDNRLAFWQSVTSFLPFAALTALMFVLLPYSIGAVLVLAVLNAFLLVRIFIIQHDCGHQSFTASKQTNDALGLVSSLLTFIPYRYWAKSHNFHHGHNGLLWEHRDIGDVDLLTVSEYSQRGRVGQWAYRIYRSVPVMFVIGPVWYIFVHCRLPMINLRGWDHARLSLWRHNVLLVLFYAVACWLLGWQQVLLVHGTTLVFFGMIAVWFFYVQHQHEHTYKQWREEWEYVKAAVQGSTFYDLPRWMHWLTGNIGYHHIHHLNALVPSYQLPRCYAENPELRHLAQKMTFAESLSCVFNHLWDEQQQRMISFRTYARLYPGRSKAVLVRS
jgi:omega-6 fatty acid desaturase (delta-12 desaturase)